MKTLLLADIPPCPDYTGGVALAEQCYWLDKGTLAAFIVLNPALKPTPAPGLEWIQTRIVPKPSEFGQIDKHGLFAATAREAYKATVLNRRLVNQAIKFGKEQGCDRVWAVMEGQTVIRMALAVARGLRVPLYTQVWDPPSWWLREHGVDKLSARHVLRCYDSALRASRGCAAASWAMAERYAKRYKVPTIPLPLGYPRHAAQSARTGLRKAGSVTIAMVGQFYADDAWKALIEALDSSEWTVGGRAVSIYYLGNESPPLVPRERLILGGWKRPIEAIAALAEVADICYCPYPFSAQMRETAELSFPSKAVMYMASGLPILCHAPPYSSPAKYFMRNKGAVICGDTDPLSVLGLLNWIVTDPSAFAATAAAARDAFLADMTVERLRESFLRFLDGSSEKMASEQSAMKLRGIFRLNGGRKQENLEDVLRALETSHREVTAKLGAMTGEATELWTIRHENEGKIASLEAETERFRDHSARSQERIDALEAECEHQRQAYEMQAKQFNDRLLRYDAYVDQLEAEAGLQRQNNEAQTAKFDALSSEYMAKLEALEAELQQFRGRYWYFEVRARALQDELIELESAGLLSRITSLFRSRRKLASEGLMLNRDYRFLRRLITLSKLFDADFYLASYPDVARSGMDPLTHYLTCGGVEGRAASSIFDSQSYLEQNPDVAEAKTNPLVHFLYHGILEGRRFKGADELSRPKASLIQFSPKTQAVRPATFSPLKMNAEISK